MTITYIYHSCYVIEGGRFSVIIDFFKDVKREDGTYWVRDYLLSKPLPLYVLSTHSHSDHFNPEILSWKKEKENITYVFSSEIKDKLPSTNIEIHFLNKLDVFEDERIFVQAFGSTDVGGSFAIKMDNQTLFHAGDLNNWHWRDEVPKSESCVYENNFLCELELLAEYYEEFTLSMFPCDPRLGKEFSLGAQQFIDRIRSHYLLPMHFGDDFAKINVFQEYLPENGCQYLPIHHTGQSFEISE